MKVGGGGSYDPRDGRGIDVELARLEAQAALSWPQERDLIGRILGREDPHILEIGSGSGAVTVRLAQSWPSAAITGLEPDPGLLDLAERRLARGGPADEAAKAGSVRLVRGSIEENDLPDGVFDLAFARYVFQHLPDPVAAARAILPKLAPGGILLLLDVDAELWGAAEPRGTGISGPHARAEATQQRRGGSRLVGRKLWPILRAAGYEECRLDAFCYHSGEAGLDAFEPQLNPDRLLAAVASGDLPYLDYLRLVAEHKRFMADPGAFVLMLGFAAWGRRPA